MSEDSKSKDFERQTVLPLALDGNGEGNGGITSLNRNLGILEKLAVSRDEIKRVLPDIDADQLEDLFSLLREKKRNILPFILDEADSDTEADDSPVKAEVPNENGEIEYFDIGRVYQEVDESVQQQMMSLMVHSIRRGKMALPVFYYYPEMWEGVCLSPDYHLQRKGLDILGKKMGTILDFISSEDEKDVKIYDLGIGTGKKAQMIIKRAIDKYDKKVEFHGVDASPHMLRHAVTDIAIAFLFEALNKKDKPVPKDYPWKDLLDFIKKHNLTFSRKKRSLDRNFKRIFLNHIKGPENVSLEGIETDENEFEEKRSHAEKLLTTRNKVQLSLSLEKGSELIDVGFVKEKLTKFATSLSKFCTIEEGPERKGDDLIMVLAPLENKDLLKYFIARMLRLHKRPHEELLRELDEEVCLPLSIHPHVVTFDQLKPEEFIPTDEQGVGIFNLGGEIGNQFPGDSLDFYAENLSDPIVPEGIPNPVPPEFESEIQASYAILGLEISQPPKNARQKRKLKNSILRSYVCPAFKNLTSHPLTRKFMNYYDADTGKELDIDDIGYFTADYEEDPDHEGYYAATHRFVYTRNFIMKIGEEEIPINGADSVNSALNEIGDALFKYESEQDFPADQLKRFKKLLQSKGVTSKKDILKMGAKEFYEKRFNYANTGKNIAEQLLQKPLEVENLFLYPSYKPALQQMLDLAEERHLRIVAVLQHRKDDPNYIKIILRKMTKGEIEAKEFEESTEAGAPEPANTNQALSRRRARRRTRHSEAAPRRVAAKKRKAARKKKRKKDANDKGRRELDLPNSLD